MRDTFFCGVPVQTFYSKWTMCRMLLRTYRKSSSVLDTGSWSGAWTAIIFHVLLDWCPFLSTTDLSFYKWRPDAKSWLTGKVPDAGKDWGQEKRAPEDEMAEWHHWCDGHKLGQTPEDGEGQGGLVCCWGRQELDTAGWLKNGRMWCLILYKLAVTGCSLPEPPCARYSHFCVSWYASHSALFLITVCITQSWTLRR